MGPWLRRRRQWVGYAAVRALGLGSFWASEVSDLTRKPRQRQFLTDMFQRVAARNDSRAIFEAVEAVAPHLTIDDQLTLVDVAWWLWDDRSSAVSTAEIPVAYQRTEQGASVLVPTVEVEELAAEVPF